MLFSTLGVFISFGVDAFDKLNFLLENVCLYNSGEILLDAISRTFLTILLYGDYILN